MDRRDALRRLTTGAALPLVGLVFPAELLAWGREVHASIDAGQQAGAGSLSAQTLRILTPACERIIPTDDTPGATAAGVPAFIGHMLANWYDEPERARVIAGLESLDAISRTRHGQTFDACSTAQQDVLLLELDREGPTHWFGTVKYFTIWGYYTSEIGVVRELGEVSHAGRYDGCAPYAPRKRAASESGRAS
jgi:gluconate 2-dehydrogenase gamma chain